jgi:hypothetical protein
MDDHQIKALQKVLSCAEEAYEKFRPAIGQRHFVVGPGGSTGDRVCPDLYSRILEVEGELLSLIHEAENELAKAGVASPKHYGRWDIRLRL